MKLKVVEPLNTLFKDEVDSSEKHWVLIRQYWDVILFRARG